MSVVNISPNQVLPGMIIADDVISGDGIKLVTRNTIVNEKIVVKLKMGNIKHLSVFIPQSLADRISADDPIFAKANKLKSSPQFKIFEKEYLASTDALKGVFSDIVMKHKASYEVKDLLSSIDNVLKECENSMTTFEMLHCMRDYDDLTYVHSLNVSLICHSFAKWLNLSEDDINAVTAAGLLHDIGKTMIPIDIIGKPGKLTAEEYGEIKKHPILGYQLIMDAPLDARIKEAVLSHHERMNGTGYPRGLKDGQIGDFAKIVSITDVYDAMTATRVYRGPICPFDVVERMESDGYSMYDAKYLLTFLQHIAQSYINSPVLLTNSLRGEVIMINKSHLSRPVVKVEDQFFDLSSMDVKVKCLL
jgi:putative nucleotidyltransferase with HDIG domain